MGKVTLLNKINIGPSKQKLIIYIVLAVVTLAVYWQVNQFDFVNVDDDLYVTGNTHTQSGMTLEGIRWAFGTKYTGLWHPLLWLSFMLDYQIYGMKAGGYHVTNLILHILSTLLLFWLFNRMTKEIWKSAFVAALFALHPLHVESVAWVAERKDVLSAFFWMLTLCLYVYYTERSSIRRYMLVLFSFTLALMSKPMVVTLPVIMILLDYWPLKRFESQKINLFLWQLKEKFLLFILSVSIIIITIYTPNTLDITENLETDIKQFSLLSRLTNALVAFVTYLGKTFWPHNMSTFYLFPEQLPTWQSLGSAIIIVIITITTITMAKKFQYLFVGWFWYAFAIFPVIGILQMNEQAMADHYSYLPSIGISIMLAWGIPILFPRELLRIKILFPVGFVVLFILSFLSWQQCGYWKDSKTLFNHATQATKNNYMAYNNLGVNLYKEGKIIEAIDQFNKAIRIKPEFALSYLNRGNAYVMIGQHKRAIEDYKEAIKLRNDYAYVYYNMGTTYLILHQYPQAIESYNKTILLKPTYANTYSYRGIAYFLQNDNERGCPDAKKACNLGACKLLEWANGKGFCQ